MASTRGRSKSWKSSSEDSVEAQAALKPVNESARQGKLLKSTFELSMIRWALLLLAVFANLILAVSPYGTCLVTWAQIAPKEISCSLCGQPEVQQALIKAVELGRQQMCSRMPEAWLLVCLALFNLALIAGLLFFPVPSRPSRGKR